MYPRDVGKHVDPWIPGIDLFPGAANLAQTRHIGEEEVDLCSGAAASISWRSRLALSVLRAMTARSAPPIARLIAASLPRPFVSPVTTMSGRLAIKPPPKSLGTS